MGRGGATKACRVDFVALPFGWPPRDGSGPRSHRPQRRSAAAPLHRSPRWRRGSSAAFHRRVMRIRLQLAQNGLLTEAMKPTCPLPSAKAVLERGLRAGPDPAPVRAARFPVASMARISSASSTLPRSPQVLRVERHELDVAHLEAALARAKTRERHDVGLHQVLHSHRIQLDGPETQAARRFNACQHTVQLVAPGDLAETRTVERIQVDVDAAQPGPRKRSRLFGQQHAVSGQRQVGNAGNGGQAAKQERAGRARTSGSPAGDAQFGNAQARGNPREALDLFEMQDLAAGERTARPSPACSRSSGYCNGP